MSRLVAVVMVAAALMLVALEPAAAAPLTQGGQSSPLRTAALPLAIFCGVLLSSLALGIAISLRRRIDKLGGEEKRER